MAMASCPDPWRLETRVLACSADFDFGYANDAIVKITSSNSNCCLENCNEHCWWPALSLKSCVAYCHRQNCFKYQIQRLDAISSKLSGVFHEFQLNAIYYSSMMAS